MKAAEIAAKLAERAPLVAAHLLPSRRRGKEFAVGGVDGVKAGLWCDFSTADGLPAGWDLRDAFPPGWSLETVERCEDRRAVATAVQRYLIEVAEHEAQDEFSKPWEVLVRYNRAGTCQRRVALRDRPAPGRAGQARRKADAMTTEVLMTFEEDRQFEALRNAFATLFARADRARMGRDIVLQATINALAAWCKDEDCRAVAEEVRRHIAARAEFHAEYTNPVIPPWQVVIRYDQAEAWRRVQARDKAARDKTVQRLRELVKNGGQGRLEGI